MHIDVRENSEQRITPAEAFLLVVKFYNEFERGVSNTKFDLNK